LYILLYHHPNPDIRYHWGFYDHSNSEEGGWKFDIINPGGVWRLAFPYGDGKPRTDLLDPDLKEPLGVMVQVGSVQGGQRERVHEVIRADDDRLNDLNAELPGAISCKVYVKRACERLKEAGFIEYADWADVEKEVLRNGDANQGEKGKNVIVVGWNVDDVDKQ
jgi:hypothetical protein